MVFSSVIFLFYFLPMALALYYAASFSRRLQNGVLLILSLIFYAWGEVKFVFIMILSIVVNYILGLLVDKYRLKKKVSQIILIASCIFNLGILFIFKYLTFVIININNMQDHKFYVPNIALPIGISFFTFQAMSYVIDVYRNNAKVEKSLFRLGLYISFFPQLIAGPIVRFEEVSEQIVRRKETWQKFGVGACRFVTGLGKKVLISNTMAIVADRIFNMNTLNTNGIPMTLAWVGSIAYTIQIYFDFSGYSDMAIGLGLMFGFKFDNNFNYPYISKSISEFWRRWHISLGNWFKEYVYFPLGGSRVSNKDKIIRNLFAVWILTGIWHGAEWTFIMWGLLNFVFIAAERLVSFEKLNISDTVKHIYAMFIINIGWVIFRAPNLNEAGRYIASMFTFRSNGFYSAYAMMFLKEYMVFFIAGIIFSMPVARTINEKMVNSIRSSRVLEFSYPIAIMMLFIICISYVIKGAYNPFIYFNF